MLWRMIRAITAIVIHCSASPNGRSLFTGQAGRPGFVTPVMEIDRWHRERGFKRSDAARAKINKSLCCIGYHYLVYTNGAIAAGRGEDEVGAHAHGFNAKSLGVCLIGTSKFTPVQWEALRELMRVLVNRYPQARVLGHRDLPNVAKECPGFDVAAWLSGGMAPLKAHVWEGSNA